jgi:hypothetical protein
MFVGGISILQPHFLLPVEAGERCRVDWLLLRLPEQLVNISTETNNIVKSNCRIRDVGVLSINIFISLILRLFYATFHLKSQQIFLLLVQKKKCREC